MKTVETWGNYSVIEYGKDLTTIDFSDENIEVTIQSFTTVNDAVRVFGDTVKKLPKNKAMHHNTDIVNAVIKG